MNIINLAEQRGLGPKWVAGTNGGEYATFCPECSGTDRFRLWPNQKMKNCEGAYWCRQCEISGDSINFCMKYLNMTFKQSIEYLGVSVESKRPSFLLPISNKTFPTISTSNNIWIERANLLVKLSHQEIFNHPEVVKVLEKRGLNLEAIKKYQIGYNAQEKFEERETWGLKNVDEKGKHMSKVWIPVGIVIPTIDPKGKIARIKIRRKDWNVEDKFPKYVALSGGEDGLNIFGKTKDRKIVAIIESELDALAVDYLAGDFVCAIAIGGSKKNPDNLTDYIVKKAEHLLICHDRDDTGFEVFTKWKSLYLKSKRYFAPMGKDIGESIENGFDVRTWFMEALNWPEYLDINATISESKWAGEDKALTDWILQYIEKMSSNKFYINLANEIAQGPNSPRAKTGELQRGLRLMKSMLEEELISRQNKES